MDVWNRDGFISVYDYDAVRIFFTFQAGSIFIFKLLQSFIAWYTL
jgi:hypothetical protein